MSAPINSDLPLGITGFTYADLHQPSRLRDLHKVYENFVQQSDPALFSEFQNYRQCQGQGMEAKTVSDLLVRMAPYVGRFITRLFRIEDTIKTQTATIQADVDTVFCFRSEIVSQAAKKFKNQDISGWDLKTIRSDLNLLKAVAFPAAALDSDAERSLARVGTELIRLAGYYRSVKSADSNPSTDAYVVELRNKLNHHAQAKIRFAPALKRETTADFIDDLLAVVWRWSYAAQHDPELSRVVANWSSFKVPKRTDPNNLVTHEIEQTNGFPTWVGLQAARRQRDGFTLTDPRFNQRQVQYEIDHCIYCHERDADSCSKGMRNKKGFQTNQFGTAVIGCPLEEKISEMHVLKRRGDNIGALALIIIDNPMCPGTGHRICNDCMKGCIYQKTEPVNIPQIETNVLTDVLFLPWGFEIYSLLTRWNPLNIKRPYALPYNGKKILVVGLGPAGYTLAHYLINEGFGVVGIDALKIEPLADELTGANGCVPEPVQDFSHLYEQLDKRVPAGFGGVAEYGITARWDKNFLKVIYLNLVRRRSFNFYGGVRFGGTITIEEAWDLGFDHVAIASGAGKPTIINIRNNLIRGIRKASDFLMALQLTGAAKHSSLANLQVRLPAGVIGGGLTALDTCTEVMAYYPIQVEKILHRYEKLTAEKGEAAARADYDVEELGILDEFLSHGRAIRGERQRAKAAGTGPDFQPLIDEWGGVTMFYRKRVRDAPAYRQNHEEINSALQEGIHIAEGMNPKTAIADEYGALKAVEFEQSVRQLSKWQIVNKSLQVNLRSLFIAAGTSPNTIYEQEFPGTFKMDGDFFQRYEPRWCEANDLPELVAVSDVATPKIGKPAPLSSYHKAGKYVSFYGDNHPVYAGNVVKAMASAKDGYPYIVRLFDRQLQTLDPAQQITRDQKLAEFFRRLDEELKSTVVETKCLAPNIIEVIVKAPMQARKFQPGQFYRVQNLESLSRVVDGTVLASEGLALTGAWVDKDQGFISLIALAMGSSSRLCALWQPSEPLVVMGVTGQATEISQGKTVMLIGGGLGNAVQFSIGKALRQKGNRVIYFAGYKRPEDLFKTEEIEKAADVVVWSIDPAPGVKAFKPTRPQDRTFLGNVVEAMVAYAKGELGSITIKLKDVDHMIVIGSDRMMAAVKQARFKQLKPYLKSDHTAIGSINSPMQCMMKGVCAQCLCKHVDPNTGEDYFVYSCYNQDQDLDRVDFLNLNARLRQNTVQEKLSWLWLDYLLDLS